MSYLNKYSLKGKIAVIAGGNGLLGKEVVKAIHEAGAKVIVADLSSWDGNEDNIESVIIDFNNLEQMKNELYALWSNQKRIDIWINTSFPRSKEWIGEDIERMSDRFTKNLSAHLGGYCLSTLIMCELMKENGVAGSIINTSSIFGSVGHDYQMYEDMDFKPAVPYSAIKGGVNGFTRYAAARFGSGGIRVNSISPGGIDSEKLNTEIREKFNKKTPLGRMAKADEVAAVFLFLSSDASSYITGIDIFVDGGWTAI